MNKFIVRRRGATPILLTSAAISLAGLIFTAAGVYAESHAGGSVHYSQAVLMASLVFPSAFVVGLNIWAWMSLMPPMHTSKVITVIDYLARTVTYALGSVGLVGVLAVVQMIVLICAGPPMVVEGPLLRDR